MLELCESVEIPTGEVFDPSVGVTEGCAWAYSNFLDQGSEFVEFIVADVRRPHLLTLYSGLSDEYGPVISTIEPDVRPGRPLPSLTDRSPIANFSRSRIARVDRASGRMQIAGVDWQSDAAIVLHTCSTDPAEDAIAFDSCSAIGTVEPNAEGAFEVVLPIPGADTRSPADPVLAYVVATQGDRIAMIGLAYPEPELVAFPVIPELPDVVDITIRDLRNGERASIRLCDGSCVNPTDIAEIVGSGSGRDVVPVPLTGEPQQIQLVIDGEPISFLDSPPEFAIIDAAEPVLIPADAPSATITVEPASVPGRGTHAFTVRGEGWLAAPPIFILPCSPGVDDGLDAELGEACDSADLTPATPVDGAFEVTVTYDVGPDGLVIAAGDATQTQSAIAAIEVVE